MSVIIKDKADPSDNIAAVRERARRHVLDHGHRARGESDPAERAALSTTIQSAVGGCRHSLNRLAAQLLPLVRTTSLRELLLRGMSPPRAHQMAQDIAHDVFVELLKNNSKVLRRWTIAAARHDPRAFFRVIARRRAIDALRRDQRLIAGDDNPSDGSPGNESSAETVLMVRECLRRAVDRRRDSATTHAMVYDVLVAGARQVEIACDLGITPDAVYQRTSRFRRQFASSWNRDD